MNFSKNNHHRGQQTPADLTSCTRTKKLSKSLTRHAGTMRIALTTLLTAALTTMPATVMAGDTFVVTSSTATPAVGSTVTSVDGIVMTWGGYDGTTTGARYFAPASGDARNTDYGDNDINSDKNFFKNQADAWSEKCDVYINGKPNNDYRHHQTSDPTHKKTFLLPAEGSFYKFEATKSGTLTVYVEQQGAVGRSYNSTTGESVIDPQVLKRRPVYFLDETGTTVAATSARTTSKVAYDTWSSIASATMKADNYLSASDMVKLRQYYQTIINGNGSYVGFKDINAARGSNQGKQYTPGSSSDYQPIICLHTQGNTASKLNESDKVVRYSDTNYDGTGYMLLDEGFVNYSFEVKAGKTYYLFGYRTKLGLCGFKFAAHSQQATQWLTLDENADNSAALADANIGKQYNIMLKRTLKAGIWNALVLPFSISQTQLKETFGEGTDILHFDYREQKGVNEGIFTMYFYDHFYKMVVAGTPVLIKPAKVNSNNTYTFLNTTLVTNKVCDMGTSSFVFTGTYNKRSENTMPRYAYYFSTNDGSVKQLVTTNSVAAKPFRPWIQRTTGNAAEAKQMTIVVEGIDDNTTTAISTVQDGGNSAALPHSTAVYNIQGQRVATGAEDCGKLKAGIYIANGRKVIVR